jgi:hypothetical protein
MAYSDTFFAFVDKEACDPVKRFCSEPYKLTRAKTSADIDQRLTIVGDLLCLDRHRKAVMSAEMHSLDTQLSSKCSSDNKCRKAVIKLAKQRLE